MERGARVKVVRGRKAKDVTGTVFWVGANQYGDGERIGLHGDDGETYWLDAAHVEPTEAPPPAAGAAPEKGAKVRWRQGDAEGMGVVFWVGESRQGPGIRVGLTDLEGETRWLDARFVETIDPVEPVAAWDEEDPPF